MNTRIPNYLNAAADRIFPCSISFRSADNPVDSKFALLHFHPDIMLTYVKSGELCLTDLTKKTTIAAGEAIFVNANVIHSLQIESSFYEYKSFVFPASILQFYPGCPANDVIMGILQKQDLGTYKFNLDTDWHKDVLEHLKMLYQIDNDNSPLFTYEILIHLEYICLMMSKHIQMPRKKSPSPIAMRIAAFLQFIQKNYAAPISLSDIAASAHVSKSECLRCFKQAIQTTPYRYLLEYRLFKAAELLKTTNLPIEHIAYKVGFSQSSQFGRCFKRRLNCSPLAYRRHWHI